MTHTPFLMQAPFPMQVPFQAQVIAGRAILSVEGEDALPFLQSLVTCDISALQLGEAAYGALLNPQGKIFTDFFILRTEEGFLIDCAASRRSALTAKLDLYKLRSRLRISNRDELDVGACTGDCAPPLSFTDPRLAEMGCRMIVPKGTLPHASGYEARRIELGLADSDLDIGAERLFPHEANFDLLNGVSFNKGCYVGQEVVSRMQHRGTTRSRILPARFNGTSPLAGSELTSGGKPVGIILSVIGLTGLALVRLDRWAEAEWPLLAAGHGTDLFTPPWLEGHLPSRSPNL